MPIPQGKSIPKSARSGATRKTPTKQEKSAHQRMEQTSMTEVQRLIEVYCELVKSALVPSTALELHLLCRMLSVPISDLSNPQSVQDSSFSCVFSSAKQCTYFARECLLRLSGILRGYGKSFLIELVRCAPFRVHLPDMVSDFEALIRLDATRVDASLDFSPNSQIPLLTLPFNEERDSRHNYKTREEQALYKNREESRDAFLYQFRSFLNVRGKLVDTGAAEKEIKKIERSSRTVVNGVMGDNVPWFADFFCDLLLQTGLVPLQETDTDLLRIAGKEKLQKLHKRFGSMVPLTEKSTKKLVAERHFRESIPAVAAQQFFPGHQEFFFLFLMSADSFIFGLHLRRVLAQNIKKLAAATTVRDFERQILKMQLLGRFVGVLFFAPNWVSSTTKQQSPSLLLSTALCEISIAGLPMLEMLGEACQNGNLVSFVPWVVEVLKMSIWDRGARNSFEVRQLLAYLRQIQLLYCRRDERTETTNSVRELIFGSIEAMLDEVLGLGRTTSLELTALKLAPMQETGLDCIDFTFSSTLLFASYSHLEELMALISKLSRPENSTLTSPRISRKLRPSFISPTVSPDQKLTHSSHAEEIAGEGGLVPSQTRRNTTIHAKLRFTFFHQHSNLKEASEFAMDQILKLCSAKLLKAVIHPTLTQSLADGSNHVDSERCALAASLEFIRSELHSRIGQVLDALVDSRTSQKVKSIACSLAVNHGLEVGNAMASAMVATAMKSMPGAILTNDRRRLFDGYSTNCEIVQTNLVYITGCLRDLLIELKMRMDGDFSGVDKLIQKVLKDFEEWLAKSGSTVPIGNEFRSFIQVLLQVDSFTLRIMKWSLLFNTASCEMRWCLLTSYLEWTCLLSRISRFGLKSVRAFLSESENLVTLVSIGSADDRFEGLCVTLRNLRKAKLLSKTAFEKCILICERKEILNTASIDSIRKATFCC
jgi:hypothetical protein